MADYDSSLPIRTEAAGDVDVFISDRVTPSQKLKVNADGSIDTNFAAGAKVIITDGTDDVEVNADGSINAVVTATDLDIRPLVNTDVVTVEDGGGSITVDAVALDVRALTNADVVTIEDGGGSITVDGTVAITGDVNVTATDLDIRDLTAASDSVQANLFDQAGVAYSATNPMPVEMVSDQAGDEIVEFNQSSAVAKDASVNHDYAVTAAKTFLGEEAWISGSGKLKLKMLVDGATVFVGFNSTANPNIRIPLEKIVKAAATQVVRFRITNRDEQAQDVYSTLTGLEV